MNLFITLFKNIFLSHTHRTIYKHLLLDIHIKNARLFYNKRANKNHIKIIIDSTVTKHPDIATANYHAYLPQKPYRHNLLQ